MIKIYLTAIIAVICYYTSFAQQYDILHLNDVIKYHYLNSSDAKKAGINYDQTSLNVENFDLKKLPTISIDLKPVELSQSIISLQDPETGKFNYTNSFVNRSNLGITITQPINIIGGNLQINSNLNIMNELSPNHNTFSTTPIQISYYQPIVGGRKKYLFEREIIQHEKKKIDSTLKSNQYTIQQRCVELYMMVLSSDIAHKNALLNSAITDTVYMLSKIKYSVGEITELEFVQSEIQFEQSKTEIINNETKRKQAMRELLTYLKMDNKYYEVVIPELNLVPHICIDRAILDVKAYNPKFIEMKQRNIEAERDLFNAKSQSTFNGDVSFSYGLNQYSTQFLKAYQNPSARQMISIGFRIPLIDWGINKNNYKIAKLKHLSTTMDIVDSEIDIIENLRTTVDAYNYSVKMLGIAERQLRLSRKQYQLITNNFKSSVSSFFELATARNQLLDVERSYLDKLSQSWISYYTVRAITLTEY